MLLPLYAPLIAILVTLILGRILLSSNAGQKIQDVPNERSLHHQPIPRVGGVALIVGVLSSWAQMAQVIAWWLLLPLMMLFAFSLLDDIRGLSAGKRLLVHIAAAAMMVLGSGTEGHSVMLGMMVLLGLVWMTNLFNFMDGADGLAGGMAFFGFATYGVVLLHGDGMQAMLNFSIAAAALGFLYYNFYPARVFMGDAGSIPLGFLAAAMGVLGWQQGNWPLWFPVLVFSPFIMDASMTLVKRLLRGEIIWQAHHGHYYQRLVRLGWGHKKTAIFYYGLMLSVAVSAIWLLEKPQAAQLVGLFIWCGIYAVLGLWVDHLWRMHEQIARPNR